MGMFVCVHDVGALPMVPEVKSDFAFPMVCYISAYGRPLTRLSFVCLRARDRWVHHNVHQHLHAWAAIVSGSNHIRPPKTSPG